MPEINEIKSRVRYAVLLAIVSGFYFLINRLSTPRFDFSSILDQTIPFSPAFGLFYFSYIPFLVWGVGYAFFYFPLEKFQNLITTLISVQIIAYICHIVIPTTILRPQVLDTNFFNSVITWIYWLDNPSNLTPSLHVANSVVIYLFYDRNNYWKWGTRIWAFLIIISTVIIKQHLVIDVVTGVVLSYLAFFTLRFIKERRITWSTITGKKMKLP